MEENEKKEFTPIMAIVDYIPVISFCFGGIVAYTKTNSVIFLIGVIICTLAGLFKASWKLIASLTNNDYKIMTKLFHILMPTGFLLMIVSIPFDFETFKNLFVSIFKMPSLVFTIIGCVCMALMVVFAIKLDSKKASSNWIEQSTNTVAQIFFAIALLLI